MYFNVRHWSSHRLIELASQRQSASEIFSYSRRRADDFFFLFFFFEAVGICLMFHFPQTLTLVSQCALELEWT